MSRLYHSLKRQAMRKTAYFLSVVAIIFGAHIAHAQEPTDPYNYSRTSSFTYDAASGLLLTQTVEPGNTQLCATTTYTYDAYGNKRSAVTTNCSGATGNALFVTRSSGNTYAQFNTTTAGTSVTVPAGAFPTTTTNGLTTQGVPQSDTKVFDPRFGVVSSLTGPNLLSTVWTLDDFGRTIKTTRADNTSTGVAYCYLSSAVSDVSSNSNGCPAPDSAEIPGDAVSFVYTVPYDSNGAKSGPFTRVYADRAGRMIRTVTEAFDGTTQAGIANRLVVQDTDYTALGATTVATQPYFLDTKASTGSGSNSYGMTHTDYDALGRPVAIFVSDPQGLSTLDFLNGRGSRSVSVTTVTYSPLVKVTTVRDSHNKALTRTEEMNVDGKVVRVTDALGAQIAYQHDAFGNMVKTKDALQNVVALSYDISGRKVKIVDPDAGTWKYEYDALGALRLQTNPVSQTAAMTYDGLGRMTQRVEPEATGKWSYDTYADGTTCVKGIGKLCESSSTAGLRHKAVYDSYGRPINGRATVSLAGGPSFATAVSYDSAGRVASQTYPTGLLVNYNYTAKGFLSTLTLGTSATLNPLPTTVGGTTPPAAPSLAAGKVLWQAKSYNAWGRPEQQSYGNGVTANASFESATGRPLGMTAGVGTGTDVMNYGYAWDNLGHLTARTDANGDGTTGAVTDSLSYDDIGRLQSYVVSAPQIAGTARTVTLQYNALGSVLANSDVGVYTYPVQGGTELHPHAVKNVSSPNFSSDYNYDARGNMTTASAGRYSTISYNSFNMPNSSIGIAGAAANYQWLYDENHQRFKETHVVSGVTRTTWMLHPDNAGGLGFESEQIASATSNRHYLSANGVSIGVLVSSGALPTLTTTQTAPTPISSIALAKTEYWHKDHLGSLVATTDHAGLVTARYSYDPFGKRRTAAGNYDANGTLVYDWKSANSGTDRGYTGHEHLDDVGVIHMNGRTFDPRLGVFMQADPFIQDPNNLQNFNRYGYCYNNPMTCTDPTGQVFGWDMVFYAIVAIWGAEKAGIIDVRTARTFTAIAVAAVMPVPNTLGQAAINGFTSGTIATGNVRGGLQGAFTAGMFFGAGNVINGGNFFSYQAVQGPAVWGAAAGIALHGVVGCTTSVVGGGKCGPGGLSAAFSEATSSTVKDLSGGNRGIETALSAAVGGAGSVLGGGKFSNGALTGAFSYLYNGLAHPTPPPDAPLIRPTGNPYVDDTLELMNDLALAAWNATKDQDEKQFGPVFGTHVHTAFSLMVGALQRGDLHVEQSFDLRGWVDYGTPGSIRTDVILGTITNPVAIFDLKTGGAKLTQARADQIRSMFPGFKGPIFAIYPHGKVVIRN